MSVIMNRHSLVNTADPPSISSASLSPWRPRAAVTSQPASGEVTKEKSEALKSCLRVFVELLFTQAMCNNVFWEKYFLRGKYIYFSGCLWSFSSHRQRVIQDDISPVLKTFSKSLH